MNEPTKPKLRYRIADLFFTSGGVLIFVFAALFALGLVGRMLFAWLHLGWRFASHIGL